MNVMDTTNLDTTRSTQTTLIIVCAVAMLLLSAIAVGLRFYTRFVIARVASYEELLIGLSLVGLSLSRIYPSTTVDHLSVNSAFLGRLHDRYHPTSVQTLATGTFLCRNHQLKEDIETEFALGHHIWTVTPEDMIRFRMVSYHKSPNLEWNRSPR
jgi:hypothetical protein